MPLITANLQANLLKTFNDMENDNDFATGIANAVQSFLSTGLAVGVESGNPEPVTPAAAPGIPIILAGALAENDLDIAQAIANGTHAIAMTGVVGKVFAGVPATINTGLLAVFETMKTMQEGGDPYFAQQAALLITAYATAGGIT